MTSKIEIKDTLKHGKGVFATETINKGEVIKVLSGEIISSLVLTYRILLGRVRPDDPLQIEESRFIILDNVSRCFNHSCRHSTGLRKESELFALREIQSGEEITYDYSSSVCPIILSRIWQMTCKCGENNCRSGIGCVLTIPKNVLETYIAEGALQDHIKRLLTGKNSFNANSFAEKTVGLSFFVLTGYAFSYVLYPFVIYKLGALLGGVVMTFLSFVLCLVLLKIYDLSGRDWLGIEAVKGLKDYTGSKRLKRLTAWIMKKSEPVIFLFLSIKFDAFITTAYLRYGKYNGMSKRDWTIFMGSLIIGNAYWTLACFMGITLFEWGWKILKSGTAFLQMACL